MKTYEEALELLAGNEHDAQWRAVMDRHTEVYSEIENHPRTVDFLAALLLHSDASNPGLLALAVFKLGVTVGIEMEKE